MPQTFKNILIAAANSESSDLRLDEELRVIEKHVREVYSGNPYRLLPAMLAVRADDFHKRLMQSVPYILHFSGHGAAKDGLHFQDNNSYPVAISGEKLARLFALINKNLQLNCVVLNACWSEVHARAIHQNVPYVIGMQKEIDDTAALEFSDGFYAALSAGNSIEEAFEHGKISLDFEHLPDSEVPKLLINRDLVKKAQQKEIAQKQQPGGEGMSERKQSGSRNVNIRGNSSGNVIITGDHNVSHYQSGNISSGPEIAIGEVIESVAALKTILADVSLSGLAQKQLDNSIEEIELGFQEKTVDKKQIGTALQKALEAAGKSEDFLEKSIGIASHLKKIVGWLGDNWQHLLKVI